MQFKLQSSLEQHVPQQTNFENIKKKIIYIQEIIYQDKW